MTILMTNVLIVLLEYIDPFNLSGNLKQILGGATLPLSFYIKFSFSFSYYSYHFNTQYYSIIQTLHLVIIVLLMLLQALASQSACYRTMQIVHVVKL